MVLQTSGDRNLCFAYLLPPSFDTHSGSLSTLNRKLSFQLQENSLSSQGFEVTIHTFTF